MDNIIESNITKSIIEIKKWKLGFALPSYKRKQWENKLRGCELSLGFSKKIKQQLQKSANYKRNLISTNEDEDCDNKSTPVKRPPNKKR